MREKISRRKDIFGAAPFKSRCTTLMPVKDKQKQAWIITSIDNESKQVSMARYNNKTQVFVENLYYKTGRESCTIPRIRLEINIFTNDVTKPNEIQVKTVKIEMLTFSTIIQYIRVCFTVARF